MTGLGRHRFLVLGLIRCWDSSLNLIFYLFVMCVHVHVHVSRLAGVGSLLPPSASQELSPGCQAWWQLSLPTQPSCLPPMGHF